MSARPVNAAGLAIIKASEGLRLRAYRCPAGIWTIGYGQTGVIEGKKISPGLVIDLKTAERWLELAVRQFAEEVERCCPVASDNQFSAMVSLAYNIGPAAFARSSVARYHRAGLHTKAADSFALWVRGGGRVLPGLVRRRASERELYRTPDTARPTVTKRPT